LARGPSFGVEVTRPVTTRDRSRPGFSFRGKGRTSTAPKGLRFQTKERGSSPPGTMSRVIRALASGGTVGSRWPEGLRRQRSNETRHHPERGAANSRRVHICLSRRSMTRRLANPRGSPCHRYPAFASFPPTGPALLGARFRASPGIRVSRSGRSRKNSMMSGPGGIKKPSGAGLGRVRRNGFSISHQTRSLPCVALALENGP
jgi:hypothetical protein